MANLASLLKSEISRIAKREVRAETAALKKSSAQHRSDIAALKRRVAELESALRKAAKMNRRAQASAPSADEKSLRFRLAGFIAMRKKLDLSAAELGKLMGVSAQSIYKWEQGKAKPRAAQLKAIAAVRQLGKREAHARLGR